ncbi:unnamed protein product [Microthlaspi erraticum]|uniref:Protein-tyrosine-phosphatase MKP1 C-terminal domain-containing protein n=1 Tax=Microthlaspi erraticum TaxID=1685480 RepID=A0A6D2JS53_9BRAS|nr:unnamed protein product [Microthlaspi erraticum]
MELDGPILTQTWIHRFSIFLSPDSVCPPNSSNSLKGFSQTSGLSSLRPSSIPPPLALPKFSSLSLLPSQTSPQPYTEPSPNRRVSPSLAERRGSLKKSLKLPGLAGSSRGTTGFTLQPDDGNDIVFNLEGVRNGDLNPLSECKETIPSSRIVDSELPQNEMSKCDEHESGSGGNLGKPLACRWPSMEMITELSRAYLDSESAIGIQLPSDDVGKTGSRTLYIWIGKSFSLDNNSSLLDSNTTSGTVENLDWVEIGEIILSQMDLPKDTPIKIVREAEDQTEFLALLSAL